MLPLNLGLQSGRPPVLLFIGAHCDDIEIGCGGTVLELLRKHPDAVVHWVVLSSGPVRAKEAQHGARLMLRGAKRANVIIKDFRGAYFPSEVPLIKDFFEELKAIKPDVVFTHYRDDLHQDHRIVGELSWNTFRDHMILEYEIPKYDGGMGSPSAFVPVSAKSLQRKIDVLMKVFPSQLPKQWFTADTFRGLLRLRGIECNAPSGFAEAFYCRKWVLGE